MPSGVTLRAIHLEGVTAKTRALKTTLVKAPYNVQATDYGDYYENEKLHRYELTWTDANRDDGTCGNELWFDIYRNGRKIASTQKIGIPTTIMRQMQSIMFGRAENTTIRATGFLRYSPERADG